MKQKLLDKLENDYIEIQERYLDGDARDIFNDAYRIATINEFYDAIEWAIGDAVETNFDELLEDLSKYKGNLLDYLTNKWFGFRHPEHFNFFNDYNCVLNIAGYIINDDKEIK